MASISAAALLGSVEPRRSLDAWDIAKAHFMEGLDESERAIFNDATPENIFYNASNIQRDDQRDSKTRSLLASMQPLISAVHDYGKAVDTFANISPLYLAPIWGSIRVVLVIASGHGRFYSRTIDTFGRIGDILPRFRDYQRIFDPEKHQRFTYALSAAYLDIISLCTEFKALLRNQKKSAVKRIFQPLSPTLKVHLEDAVLRFRQHRKAVDKEAEICHMIEEKKARDLVVRNQAAAEARERQNRQKTLLSSLSKIDNEHKHRRMQRIRYRGTGEWFQNSDEYKAWSSCASTAMMCLYGIPGCGKSVLMSSLIDEILAKDNPGTKQDLAFYYCDHADKRTLDPVNIFSSLALQMLRTLGELPTNFLAMLERICHDNSTTDLEDVVHLLLKAMKRVTSVVIVLDGLDEVDEDDRKLIFHILTDIITQTISPTIKLLVASREDTSYLIQASDVALFKVRIGIDAVSGDIDCYVKHAIRDLVNREELVIGDPALEDEIFEALSRGARGMFLWVKFQLDDLCRAETDSSIRKVLKNLPRDLSETYDRLLARIEIAEQQEYIRRIFVWIICARRPLAVGELREAIAFTIGDDHYDRAKIPNDMNRLARACGNLIGIDDDENSVHIAHYTVEQYLLAEHDSQSSPFRFTKEEANLEIGEVCVAYLSFCDFDLQLTQCKDTTTSDLATLEDVVRTQSMLPPNSHPAKLVKAMKRIRGNPDTATNIQFDRHVTCLKRTESAIPLNTKYHLLSYVAENWLHHTTIMMGASEPGDWTLLRIRLFKNLALEKKFSFDIRPWDSVLSRWKGPPFILQIGWAISTNHLPLLRVISNHIGDDSIGNYFEQFVKLFVASASTSSENGVRSLRDFSRCSIKEWPASEGWERWLFRCVLEASDQSFTDTLEFCFTDWAHHRASVLRSTWNKGQLKFIGYLLLDAALHSRPSVAEIFANLLGWRSARPIALWSMIDRGPMTPRGSMSALARDAARALETAFSSESEDLMDILVSVGCKPSESFKKTLLYGPVLGKAFESSNVKKIRCCLRIFGATASSLSGIESHFNKLATRAGADTQALNFAVNFAKAGFSTSYHPQDHWIWALKAADRVDVLLAAGGIPSPVDSSELLLEAIMDGRYGRLNLLLKAGVSIQGQYRDLTEKQVQAIKRVSARLVPHLLLFEEELTSISPLCYAILHERHQMIEHLAAAGASVNEPGCNLGLAPIHFAAIADSLDGFKCLKRLGANLELTDDKGRNITDFLVSQGARRTPENSLFNYLITHPDLCSLYSWGAAMKRYGDEIFRNAQ